MQIKAKYNWLKHIDFMIVDLIALFISFLISYDMKFGRFNFLLNDEWTRYLFILLAYLAFSVFHPNVSQSVAT